MTERIRNPIPCIIHDNNTAMTSEPVQTLKVYLALCVLCKMYSVCPLIGNHTTW